MTTKKTTNQEINDRLRAAFGHPTQEPEPTIPAVHGAEGIQDQPTPSKPNQEINDAIIRIARGLGRFDKLFKAGK
jgi:hypothetical protein